MHISYWLYTYPRFILSLVCVSCWPCFSGVTLAQLSFLFQNFPPNQRNKWHDQSFLVLSIIIIIYYYYHSLSLFSSYDPELTTNELKIILLFSSTPEIVLKLPSGLRCLVDSTDTLVFYFSKDKQHRTQLQLFGLIQGDLICVPACPPNKTLKSLAKTE